MQKVKNHKCTCMVYSGEKTNKNENNAIVIGASAGGLELLSRFIPLINKEVQTSIFIAQHISSSSNSFFINHLDEISFVPVREAMHNELVAHGTVYIAPPDYHMLIEENFTISLSKDEKVNYSRPSIDVLFETAAEAYGTNLTGIILTGANKDGSLGLKKIKDFGGYTIVQEPGTAASPEMPIAAIKTSEIDAVMNIKMLENYFRLL